jgi:hypothetical protein
MATNIDKSLNQAPIGIGSADAMGGLSMPENLEADIEIEIEDPESVTIGVDGMEIVIDPDEMDDEDFAINLADELSEKQLTEIVGDLLADFEEDLVIP